MGTHTHTHTPRSTNMHTFVQWMLRVKLLPNDWVQTADADSKQI